jgi:integrase
VKEETMLETLRVRPWICNRIRSGPLGQTVDAFVEALRRDGYRPLGIRRHVLATDVFGQWLARRHQRVENIDESLVTRFAAQVPRWHSATRPGGRVAAHSSGVRLFAAFLWRTGVARRHDTEALADETTQWLQTYDAHLLQVCGLADGTRRVYLRFARALVATIVRAGRVDWRSLTADTVSTFVCAQARPLCPAHNRAPVTATRAALRFLVATGHVPAGVVAAVPTVRQWKHAQLPRGLTGPDVARVLGTLTADHARDRAIVLLLVRLGLRAGEVAALRVPDIDWHHGRVRVPPGKTGRARLLPLSTEVGDALVAALRSRPAQAPPGVCFVRARPPYRPVTGALVTAIAQRALQRAGLIVARPGAHVFRHALATHLVQHGLPMKVVADVLGHATLETTTIYAKLDATTLARVALPWPGGTR